MLNRSDTKASIAVIGCGYWGRNLVRNFAELGVLSAVCDVQVSNAEAESLKYGVPDRSLVDILGDDSIHAVAITAPAAQHYELAKAALDAGKHVFVEKPLALKVEDAEDLCQLAEQSKLTLMVGHLLRYHPAYLALRKLVHNGDLGQIKYIHSIRLNFGKFRREENILWSFAPHDISMILDLMSGEPESVTATSGSYLQKGIHDITNTNLAFPDGSQAHIFVSWLYPTKEQKLVVVGESSMAVFNDLEPWESKLQIFRHKVKWIKGTPHPEKSDNVTIKVEPGEALKLECQHFLECAMSGNAPITDGREGLAVLRVMHAAEASIARGAVVALDGGRSFPEAKIHESAIVDENCQIGDGTAIWHYSHVQSGARIGRGCTLGQNVYVGADVSIGDRCKIQNNVSIYQGVILSEGVFCGPSCVFTNVKNPRAQVDRTDEFAVTRVGKEATIGANATIVCGVELGAYSFVAAGAVVTKDVPAFALVAGNPARQIGWVSRSGETLGEDLVCPRSGEMYSEVAGRLVLCS